MKLIKGLALVASFIGSAAFGQWTYDHSTKVLTDGGDTTLTATYNSASELTITKCSSVGAVLDMSGTITDSFGTNYTIVAINSGVFAGKTSITDVVYPSTIRTIGGVAFQNCSNIKLVLPALVPESVTSFNTSGRGVYENCTSITQDFRIGYSPITTGGGQWIRNTKIAVADFGPYIKTICSFCFEKTALKELRLSEGLVQFDSGSNSGSLTNIVNAFPSTLKVLNESFRSNYLTLPEVRLENVTTLGGNFSATTIYKIWFGPEIRSFPSWMFERGNEVTNITICATNAITKIGNGSTFGDMDAVREITFMGPAQSESILNTILANVTHLRPALYVSKYQGGWEGLPGLITGADAISAALTEAQRTTYAERLADENLIGLYPVKGSTSKMAWVIHRDSIYDTEEGMSAKYLSVSANLDTLDLTTVPAIGSTAQFQAGETVDISAPQYASDGTGVFACQGWTFEYLNASGIWTEIASGSDLSATITIPSNAEFTGCRLLWNYAEMENVSKLTFNHVGVQEIDFSEEPVFSYGAMKWYETGTTVTITANDYTTARPYSTFDHWEIDNTVSTSLNPYVWEGNADITVAPVFISDWLYDASAKTITDNTSVLKVTASGSELTISTKHSAVGPLLDFSTKVSDIDGNEYSIVGIAYGAFSGNTTITKVIYPSTIRTIGGEAFKSCSNIKLVLPALVPESVTSFNTSGRGVYEGCSSITQDFRIGYSPITTGGGQWFSGTKTTKAEFGPYIKAIPSWCWERTSTIRDVTFSEGLETINSGSYEGGYTNIVNAFPSTLKKLNQSFRSSNLTIEELRLENVTTLGANFYKTKVKKAYFGPGITSFPDWLFQGDNYITNITICATNAITRVGNSAFADTDDLEEITFMGPAQSESILNSILTGVKDLKTIMYVSRAQGGWDELSNLVSDETAINELLTEAQRETYAHLLSNNRLMGLYKVKGSASKRVWVMRRASIYDKQVGSIIFVK